MRKIWTLTGILLSVFPAISQVPKQLVKNYTARPTGIFSSGLYEKADTTLFPASFSTPGCSQLTIYTFPQGFIFGVNDFWDKEKGYLFNAYGNVTELRVPVAFKVAVGDSASSLFYAKIYSIDPTDSSATLLATSNPIPYLNIDTNKINGIPNINTWTFTNPVAVSGWFLATVDVFSHADSICGIVLFANGSACGTGDSWEVYEVQGNNEFEPIQFNWQSGQNPLLADVFMGVRIEDAVIPTGLPSYALKLAGVFPNPSSEGVNFTYHLDSPSEVNIVVTNLYGQVMRYMNPGMQQSGENNVKMDVSGFSKGVYLYTLEAGPHTLHGRFSVN